MEIPLGEDEYNDSIGERKVLEVTDICIFSSFSHNIIELMNTYQWYKSTSCVIWLFQTTYLILEPHPVFSDTLEV